jgi:hypothetical protein
VAAHAVASVQFLPALGLPRQVSDLALLRERAGTKQQTWPQNGRRHEQNSYSSRGHPASSPKGENIAAKERRFCLTTWQKFMENDCS